MEPVTMTFEHEYLKELLAEHEGFEGLITYTFGQDQKLVVEIDGKPYSVTFNG